MQNGFNYCDGNSECEQNALNLANTQLAINSNGTSTPLGGSDRLRSYPGGRYQGAHMIYFATELRWNFSSEASEEFNSFFFQDLVDELQVAFFLEQGSVSEEKSDLGKTILKQLSK